MVATIGALTITLAQPAHASVSGNISAARQILEDGYNEKDTAVFKNRFADNYTDHKNGVTT